MFNKKEKTIVSIHGMTCSHCAKRVEVALQKINSVTKVEVDFKRGNATIFSDKEIDKELIIEIIEGLDYSVMDINVV